MIFVSPYVAFVCCEEGVPAATLLFWFEGGANAGSVAFVLLNFYLWARDARC